MKHSRKTSSGLCSPSPQAEITRLAAECVEEILETIEKDAKPKPWVLIVEQHMTKLIEAYAKNRR